jgi:hypothetical protein
MMTPKPKPSDLLTVRELELTEQNAESFALAYERLFAEPPIEGATAMILRRAQLDALKSQRDELREKISAHERAAAVYLLTEVRCGRNCLCCEYEDGTAPGDHSPTCSRITIAADVCDCIGADVRAQARRGEAEIEATPTGMWRAPIVTVPREQRPEIRFEVSSCATCKLAQSAASHFCAIAGVIATSDALEVSKPPPNCPLRSFRVTLALR